MKYVSIALILGCSLSSQAQEVPIAEGMPFAKARPLLLSHQWRAVAADIDGERIGVERQLIKNGVIEIESCAIDRPFCIFNYKTEKGTCLRVITRGERIKDFVVDSWSNTCPN